MRPFTRMLLIASDFAFDQTSNQPDGTAIGSHVHVDEELQLMNPEGTGLVGTLTQASATLPPALPPAAAEGRY